MKEFCGDTTEITDCQKWRCHQKNKKDHITNSNFVTYTKRIGNDNDDKKYQRFKIYKVSRTLSLHRNIQR